MNYITSEILSQDIVKHKINYFIAPMGSGKTTASKDLALKYLQQGKKVLVLTPYIIAKAEYINDERIKRYIKLTEKGKIDLNSSKFYITYLAQIVDEYVKEERKLRERIAKETGTEFSKIHKLKFYKQVLEAAFSRFDLILIDEVDFFQTQGIINKQQIALEVDKYRYNIFEMTMATLSLLTKTNADIIAISANKFEPIREEIQYNIAIMADTELLDELTIYKHVDLKSNLSITKLTIVNVLDDVLNYSQLKEAIIRGLPTDGSAKVLLYNPYAWKTDTIRALKQVDAMIYSRKENLRVEVTNNGAYLVELQGYAKLSIINNDKESNLHPDAFDDNSIIAVNQSSARAISITKTYANSKIYAFGDIITANTLQVFGRFRKSPTECILVVNNWTEQALLDKLTTYDPTFMSSTEVSFVNIKSFKQYNNIAGIYRATTKGKRIGKAKGKAVGRAKGKAIGKAIGKAVGRAVSAKTVQKRQGVLDFIKQADDNVSFKQYLLFCEQQELPAVSRNTFKKILSDQMSRVDKS